jgi:pimeloyl-ACP methyl ester carboxylesterase
MDCPASADPKPNVINLSARRSILATTLLVAWVWPFLGCASARVCWPPPNFAAPHYVSIDHQDPILARAEICYALANESEEAGLSCCVDQYFETAVLTAPAHNPRWNESRNCALHQSSLAKLVACGQQFDRLDPRFGLKVVRDGEDCVIPITHRGFVWDQEDFQRLILVPDYTVASLPHIYRCRGMGVPLLVQSGRPRTNPHLDKCAVFPATMLLQFNSPDGDPSSTGDLADLACCSLELYDPFRVDAVPVNGSPERLAKDLSSSIAYRLRDNQTTIFSEFLNPGTSDDESRLVMLEPYQPGKIPVVLIHGLLSDALTWSEMVNELRATKGFNERFQIWTFQYPTGQPFVTSAARLRRNLALARQGVDPLGLDPQLSNMVLVGHSMGGLIAKMQVACSGSQLWAAVANRPLEELNVRPETEEVLAAAFFFEPSPHVSRVVFIATPHQGSVFARRPVGRVASLMVSPPPERQELHRELIENNPGVFSDEFTNRIPSSIDILEPNSELLKTINRLPIPERVRIHSIIGDSGRTIGYGPSDGIVTVSSAHFPKADSQQFVAERHGKIHKNMETIGQVLAILKGHLNEPRRLVTIDQLDQ